jgi:hypothetical protein
VKALSSSPSTGKKKKKERKINTLEYTEAGKE